MIQNGDSLFSSLNREQVEAVSAESTSHILVLAGAGCGKTTVLTRRIAYLVKEGFKPQSVLALTFTRKAADEMSARILKNRLISQTFAFPLITTFHGFALKVLSEIVGGQKNFQRIGFSGNVRLLSENERLQMLGTISKIEERRALGIDLLTLDALLAKCDIFPEKLKNISFELSNYLEKISDALIRKKQMNGLWDFSDLLTGCLQLFNQFPDVESFYRNKFKAILVDEFQDTNPIQIQLLQKLLSDTTRVFAVGDDDQAIYGFRGADIRPTVEFAKYFYGARIVKLQTNYRSVPAILECANRIFKDKNHLYRKVLVPGKYLGVKGGKPIRRRFDSQYDMMSWIANLAIQIINSKEISINNVAILFRTNQSLEWADKHIKTNNPEIKDITLLTIHKSKGLEFSVVFLCDLEESVFPSYRIINNRKIHTMKDFFMELSKKQKPIDCDWDEEKRLFYVGVTRAEKYLYLLSVRNKIIYGRKRKLDSSRFYKHV